MAGGVTSAEKVTELRAFAAPGTNDARLRAALVRAGGNLNHAAEILLAEPDAFPDRPTLAVPPRPGASNAQCVTPGAPVAPGASVEVIQAPVLSDSALRKMAWRAFYKKSYRTAVAAVGLDNKEYINEYIANAWKELGSARREQLAHSVRRAAEAPASSEQPPAVSIAPVRSESVRIVAPVPAATSVVPPLAPTPITVKRPRPVSVNDTIDVDAADILPDVAQSTSKKPCLEHRTPAPQADVVELVEDTFLPSSEKDRRIPAWPKELVSRLCRGSMQVNGRNLLKAGDVVLLEVPPPRKPKPAASGRGRGRGRGRGGSVSVPRPLPANNKVVRFSRKGRELGRLCPEIGRVLGPALQSGYLVAECRVVSVPLNIRMFSEIILDVTLRIRKEAFVDDEVQRALVASGTNAASSTGPSSSAANKQDGVDTKRIGIVELITSLGVCTPEKKAVSDVMPGFTKPTGADPTEVTAEAAEAYYNTVEAINKDDIADFVVPRDLRCDLREYQMAGVAWMVGREKHGSSRRRASDAMLDPLWRRMVFPDQTPFFINATTGALCLEAPGANGRGDHGGILADEMGLGKTIQTIALIVHDLNSCADEAKQSSEDKALAVKISAASVKGTDGDEIVRGLETDGKDYKDENAEYDGDVEENDDVTREDHMNDVDVPESVSALHTRAKSTVRSSRRRPLSRRNAAQKDKHVVNVDVCEILSDSDASAGKEETGDSDSEWFEKPQVRRAKPGPKSRSVLKELKRLGKLKGGTLIVCPMSLVEQWMSELHLHTAPNSVRVSSHYGHGRGDSASISTHCADVVVTTYGILASEAPIAEADDKPGKPGGPLFQVPWRRAVLDEAHYVKSRTTKWARAAFQLRAERRWCLTGTPLQNSISDIFSLLHFLRVEPWSSWAFWNRGIVVKMESKDAALQSEAMSLVRDIVSPITLRRRKDTKDSDGNNVVQLTKKTVELVSLTASPEEQEFYDALAQKTQVQFNHYLAQGKALSNYASILELLLRLRQACCHPYLVFSAAPSKDSVVMKDKDKMFKQFLDAGSSSQFVDQMLADSGKLDQNCPICLDLIDDAVAPKECGHPACRDCLMDVLERTRQCPICRKSLSKDSIATLPRASRFSIDLEKQWRSSAKIDALLRDVGEVEEQRRNASKAVGKTVVFSQFTGFLDLVGTALKRNGHNALRIDGSVSQAGRAGILEKFAAEDELAAGASNVLLVSLRAGGVGLNLVSASRAILLDIHWNPQVDNQAQDRVHRHGQTRDVVIKRYIVKGSVEERLLTIQARKQDLADGALGAPTDADSRQRRLSELKLLFSRK